MAGHLMVNTVQMAALYERNHVPVLMSSSILSTSHLQCSLI